ncbi:right-handed parallel beta-helix repeat-containing protein [Chitinophaga sp. 30R24]|uniref:right-handed parallel beta-helix repeat-containing protein n=1 Tax=Chitinophaga sp. 30R24 TaxID=3248838 RepID=UPI003B90CAE1
MNHKNYIKSLLPLLLVLLALQACIKKDEKLVLSPPRIELPLAVLNDTLKGTVKGILEPDKTYYVPADVFVNKGDTLYIPSGVKLVILGDGTPQNSPSFFINGTLISDGTKQAPNWFTVPEDKKKAMPDGGIWGGIVADDAQNIIIRWTHIEYPGAPWGSYKTPSADISPTHQGIICLGETNFILEDSWLSYTQDDACYVRNAKVNIVGNTFESIGTTKGMAVSVKYGARGDIAYNVVVNAFNSGIKSQSLSGAPSQSVVNVFNNTVINCGFLNPTYTAGGGISFEKLVAGTAFNNIIANNKIGMRILDGASAVDEANFSYGYNLYYGNDASITANFFPDLKGFSAKPQTGDIYSATPMANDPLFVNLKGSLITPTFPAIYEGIDLHLQANSPALGKGLVTIPKVPMYVASKNFPARIVAPNKDMGAYPSDGSGNQH